jgi:ATPase subunit of ABC transporter with duplicated ATPase domains
VGGDDAQPRVAAAVAEAGLDPVLLHRPMTSLSGGQAARVGFASLQAARFDVVLLDEPTNHLDADGLRRLRTRLSDRTGVVIVSHDRAVLAEAADELVELDGRTGAAEHYAGGWGAYERERGLARRRQQDAHDEALTRREHLLGVEREVRRRAAAGANRATRRPRDGDKSSREWAVARAQGAQRRAAKIGVRADRIEVPDAPWRAPSLSTDPARGRPGGSELERSGGRPKSGVAGARTAMDAAAAARGCRP